MPEAVASPPYASAAPAIRFAAERAAVNPEAALRELAAYIGEKT